MSKIKEVINSLCRITDHLGFSPLTAEDLRLAKFNKPEAVLKMWSFLHELVLSIKSKDLSANRFDYSSPEKMIAQVKIEMIKLGYSSNDFLDSMEDSQEILLACGWLISTENVCEIFISKLNQQVNNEYFKEYHNTELIGTQLETDHLQTAFQKLDIHVSEEQDVLKLNHMKRLEGLFKFKLNSYFSCLVEKSNLTHAVHSEAKNNQLKLQENLSCLDLYYIKHPHKMEEYENILEKNIELLSMLLFWLENEENFWEWMKSVMDEKLERKAQETNNKKSASADFLNDQELKEQLIVTVNTQRRIEYLIEHMKRFKAKFKKEIEGNHSCFKSDLDKCAKDNYELLEQYQTSIEKDFKSILNSDDLKEFFYESRNVSALSSKGPETSRLVLENKNKKLSLSSVKSKIAELENKMKFLELFYQEQKKEMADKCESMINGLDDCYVIYTK